MNFNLKILFAVFILLFLGCKNETENNLNSEDFEIEEFHPKELTEIDSLKTDKQVENLVNRLLDNENHPFLIRKISEFNGEPRYSYCAKMADPLGIDKAFYKADFDGNQLTDLLVIGDYYDFKIFTVLNHGNDSLELKQLTSRSLRDCVFPKIKDDSIIEYYYYSNYREPNKSGLQKKLLTYKFNDFVELNENPLEHQITEIEFETSGCFGTCPVFKLTLSQNQKSEFKAIAYNFNDEWRRDSNDDEGNFRTILKEENWNELVEILNYIDFENLEESYTVNWTDDQTAILKIHYDNGKTKTIRDYGLIGTFGLSILYKKLFEIRKDQEWKK